MIASFLSRTVLAALVWVALIEGDPTMLAYGAVAVPAVVSVSYLLTGRPERLGGSAFGRARALVVLVGWILVRSVAGGADVALRALRFPRPRVDPYWTTYALRLTSERGRTAFTLLMNLIPGTLSASREDAEVEVHVIGSDLEVTEALRTLEARVARVMGEEPRATRE